MNIFINAEEYRLRAGWRLSVQMLIMMVIIGVLVALYPSFIQNRYGNILITGTGVLLSVYLSVRFIDLKKIIEYGFFLNKAWWTEMGIGIVLGTLAMLFIFLTEWLFGWVRIDGFGWNRVTQLPYVVQFALMIASMLFVAFYEEFLFRGYQITNLVEGFLSPRFTRKKAVYAAIGISSLIFGIMHFENPNATWLSTINIVGAGVMLALPFVITGRLGMSIGIHFSWNFVQGGILGYAVSGMPFRLSLLQIDQIGPRHWTGGAFGPEAGILGLSGITLIVVLQILYFLKTQKGLNINIADTPIAANGAQTTVTED